VKGKWHVVETPEHSVRRGRWRVRLGLPHGAIHGRCEGDAVEFTWDGSDEMAPASGYGWAEIQDDGSLEGEISLEGGDDISFIARRSATSSTAC
jgi:hypothetical protein